MPFQATIYTRHGARQEARSVHGWSVVVWQMSAQE